MLPGFLRSLHAQLFAEQTLDIGTMDLEQLGTISTCQRWRVLASNEAFGTLKLRGIPTSIQRVQ